MYDTYNKCVYDETCVCFYFLFIAFIINTYFTMDIFCLK